MTEILRKSALEALDSLFSLFPAVALLGARQVGKTTLARQFATRIGRDALSFDLEDPTDLLALEEPKLVLSEHRGLVILDEIQRRPQLLPVLRVLIDRPDNPAKFLLLGSASPDLLRTSSESLAGRLGHFELDGFGIHELGTAAIDDLWVRGGFPRSYLAKDEPASFRWREAFVRSYLERDVPAAGLGTSPQALNRFWAMLAHYHGQTWNASELATAFGVARSTVERYLDILDAFFLVRRLHPWTENLGKRLVKSPKVYFRDTGLLHCILGIATREQLLRHPRVGASWEGFALEVVIQRLGARRRDCYFYRTHGGAELDLLVVAGTERVGFEFKRSSAPRTTRAMHVVREDLGLGRLDVVYPGDKTFPLADGIRAVALSRVVKDIEPLSP